ncbi:MAG: IclR family transcriptional regulator [Spirochaetes bacterium]|nr:MAG: IclR family transcriptional regulator [Spirochaetota bacterium]
MVNSVLKAVKILGIIGRSKPLGISEISRMLEIPKSSTHNLLQTLESEGFVERNEDTNKYNLGTRLIELGYRAQNDLAICRIAKPYLNGINQETDETVHLTLLDDDEVLYVDCVESKRRMRTYSVIGIKAPLYCTAVGKAILAELPEIHIKQIINSKGLARLTDKTITNENNLFQDLSDTRERGYSIDNKEHEDQLICVGAAIRDVNGEVFASLSVSGPSDRMTEERIVHIGSLIKNATSEISRKLGFRE